MAKFATEYAMKLKDLTVELSGNDNTYNRSINVGPLSDGLNFILVNVALESPRSELLSANCCLILANRIWPIERQQDATRFALSSIPRRDDFKSCEIPAAR